MKTETIYIDSFNHCHRTNDGTMTMVETDFFDGKCDAFVEGYCYNTLAGYTRIYPWKPYSELDAAQRQYEQMLITELKFQQSELTASYIDGVNSI